MTALLLPAVLVAAVPVVLLTTGGGGERAAEDATAAFPEFVYASPKSEHGYHLATQNRDLFPLLPCYCGCGVMAEAAHRSLLDCFISPDGSFDAHASGCEICVDIAVDAARWRAENKSPAAIRALVDAKYGASGVPTDTPPVGG